MMIHVRNWKRWFVGGAAGLALVAGTVWMAPQVSTAYAQTTPPAATQEDATPTQWGPHGGFEMRGGSGLADELLANALGITPAELQTARTDARKIAIQQAVDAGQITQEQADAILAGNGRGLGHLAITVDRDAALAEALGISVDELQAARDGAIDAGVEAGLLTQAQANDLKVRKMIQDAVQAARESAIQQAVDEGLITQAQADNMLNDPGFGFGPGGDGGPHHFGGVDGGFPGGRGMDRPGRNNRGFNPFNPAPSSPQPQQEEPTSQPSTSL